MIKHINYLTDHTCFCDSCSTYWVVKTKYIPKVCNVNAINLIKSKHFLYLDTVPVSAVKYCKQSGGPDKNMNL